MTNETEKKTVRKWIIREDIEVYKSYGAETFVHYTEKYKGKIIECSVSDLSGEGYLFKGWYWTREMVEETFEPEVGDFIRVTPFSSLYAYVGKTVSGNLITVSQANESLSFGEQEMYTWLNSFKALPPKEEEEITEPTPKVEIRVKSYEDILRALLEQGYTYNPSGRGAWYHPSGKKASWQSSLWKTCGKVASDYSYIYEKEWLEEVEVTSDVK